MATLRFPRMPRNRLRVKHSAIGNGPHAGFAAGLTLQAVAGCVRVFGRRGVSTGPLKAVLQAVSRGAPKKDRVNRRPPATCSLTQSGAECINSISDAKRGIH